ncbi:hypothetical protein [Rickettsia fournieri]|uniref:hypothetical protein n=1 Tax=Rickettsia fournieri TaxID=1436798 RepID=UPI0018E9FF23|nr:hypothetical protein [Rickettsia fournieri]
MTILLSQKITIWLILPKNININDINLYGFNGVFTIIEGNITINALGESGIVFQNLPTAFGTNIVININRAHMANDVAVLSILRMSNGVRS